MGRSIEAILGKIEESNKVKPIHRSTASTLVTFFEKLRENDLLPDEISPETTPEVGYQKSNVTVHISPGVDIVVGDFAQAMKVYLLRSGKMQKELAQRIGMAPSSFSRAMIQQKGFSIDKFMGIVDFLSLNDQEAMGLVRLFTQPRIEK